MAGYIPDDIVERIKAESDIVSVVSAFVNLKRSGKDYKGLCPFHQEKTPSFFVIPAKGFYHCFGCGAGGNSVNFIMAHERLDYPDALRYLAAKAGISIPETEARKSQSEALFDALALAGSYYSKSLSNADVGGGAMAYLKSRGISDETIKTFGMGYAPRGWDGLLKLAASNNIQAAILERVGLAIKKDGFYDRFRHRLMVPIRTLSGRIVGFGGRVLPGDDGPKYINSPETEVYKKGKILFGLDLSKDAIREKNEAIVVEGYFDLISLFQAGIKNVVAVSGTGFTSEQAQLLARFCEHIVLLYDSDSAGVRAAFRACGVLYNHGIEPKLIRLPKGFDPDAFVRDKGPQALLKHVADSTDVIDFIYNGLASKFAEQPLARQERIIKALAETVGQIDDPLRRSLLSQRISTKFDLMPGVLDGQMQRNPVGPEKIVMSRSLGREIPEKEFLSLLLGKPSLLEDCADIDSSQFVDEDNGLIFEMIRNEYTADGALKIDSLFDRLGSENLRRKFSEIAIINLGSEDEKNILSKYLKGFNAISIRKRREELKNLISEAEKQADLKKVDQLTREYQNLQHRGENE
jgi:DNA primase